MACYVRFNLTAAAAQALSADWPFGARRRPIVATLFERKMATRTVGINVLVSDAVDDFGAQLTDARRFLRRHAHAIAELMGTKGLKSACIDFGVADAIDGGRGPAAVMFFRFSPELIALTARAGLDLEFSVYPAAAPPKKRRSTRKSAGRAKAR